MSQDNFDDKTADEILKQHPLEKIFNLDAGSTEGFASAPQPLDREGIPIASPLRDPVDNKTLERPVTVDEQQLEREERAEDLAIDRQTEEVRVEAIAAFRNLIAQADASEPRYAARIAEVAAQYLNIALGSVDSRVDAKYKRNKIKIVKEKGGGPKTLNQNLIVADRNQLLKMLAEGKLPTPAPIEGEVKKVEE